MKTPHRKWSDFDQNESQPDTKVADAYRAVFNTPQGKIVLDDLWRRVNEPSVDYKRIDENAAIYRIARIDLFNDIIRKTEASKE